MNLNILAIIISAIGSLVALTGETYNKQKNFLNNKGILSASIIFLGLGIMITIEFQENENNEFKQVVALDALTNELCSQSSVLKIITILPDSVALYISKSTYPVTVKEVSDDYDRYHELLSPKTLELGHKAISSQIKMKQFAELNGDNILGKKGLLTEVITHNRIFMEAMLRDLKELGKNELANKYSSCIKNYEK